MCYQLAIALSEKQTNKYPLDKSYTIGRHSTCGIYLPVRFISRIHCTLILMPPDIDNESPYYVIKDGHIMGEGSQNGTWVNGESIVKLTKLSHQDVITFSPNSLYPSAVFLNDCANNDEAGGTIEHERNTDF